MKQTMLDQNSTQAFTREQKEYLEAFFAGIRARAKSFADVEALPKRDAEIATEPLIFEERVKRELHPLDSYPLLLENASANKAPGKEETFRFKWHGLFFLSPNKEAFMTRLRIPAGRLQTFQLRELAKISQELTSGYVQVTTRANLQMRLIQPKDAPEVLRRIQNIGLHTRGSGGDNIRNLTANPTAGIDPHELIDTMPLCQELAQLIINNREFYDLPRKFNIALDGGGAIGSVEDTNDIGLKAVKIGDEVLFRIGLGGATGHKAFTRDLGVAIAPSEVLKVVTALVRVFIANGNRGDRKKARLKHLLETWTLEQYLAETEKLLGYELRRSPAPEAPLGSPADSIPHSHVGVFPQKQKGLNYVGIAIPVGEITPKQMIRIADLADLYGSGEVRLTVWQNLIIPNIPDGYVETVKKAVVKMGFNWKQSHIRSGIIACTGAAFCKYAQAHTKQHANELANFLDRKFRLDQPINIHLTGCPHSCAQHYMGDIGLLATKVRMGGESVEGYHVFVGGGFSGNQAVGRQVFTGIAFSEMSSTLEKMLNGYLRHRDGTETFSQFTQRHDLNSLQAIFSNDE
jgi:ferredoxin-nitrite reductase